MKIGVRTKQIYVHKHLNHKGIFTSLFLYIFTFLNYFRKSEANEFWRYYYLHKRKLEVFFFFFWFFVYIVIFKKKKNKEGFYKPPLHTTFLNSSWQKMHEICKYVFLKEKIELNFPFFSIKATKFVFFCLFVCLFNGREWNLMTLLSDETFVEW